MLQFLLKTALFNGVAEEHAKVIAAFSELTVMAAGEHAIVEGDAHQHHDLLLLVEGEVSVETRFSPLPNAMKFNLHAIGNEMFGEIAWILGGKRSASVKCRTSCKFIKINGSRFFDYCNAHPAVGVELMTRIAAVTAQRVTHLTDLLRNKDLAS